MHARGRAWGVAYGHSALVEEEEARRAAGWDCDQGVFGGCCTCEGSQMRHSA